MAPIPVLLPGKPCGWRSLVGCSPWGHEESDTSARLHFHSSLSCIGEGNGNPLQCSCLENPRDGGAWWAAVYGVAQSRTRLKQLSSSSSSVTELRRACGFDFSWGPSPCNVDGHLLALSLYVLSSVHEHPRCLPVCPNLFIRTLVRLDFGPS